MRARRPGWARWSLPWLVVGLVVGLVGLAALVFWVPFLLWGPSEVIDSLPEGGSSRLDANHVDLRRPTLVIDIAGNVTAGGELLVDAEAPDDSDRLERFLRGEAHRMHHSPIVPANGSGAPLPDDPILLLADAHTEFAHLARIMRLCDKPDINIWKIHLGVRGPHAPWLGVIQLFLPVDVSDPLEEPDPAHDARLGLEVVRPGTRLAPDGAEPWSGEGRYRIGGDRVLRYTLAGFHTTDFAVLRERFPDEPRDWLFTDVGPGVLWEDVARVMEALGQDVYMGVFPPR